jgi:hypothetical protein
VERQTVCMGILSWHSTLLWATLTNLLFIHTAACSQGWTLTSLTHCWRWIASTFYCAINMRNDQ